MTPQAKLDGTDRVAQTRPDTESSAPTPEQLSLAERQGLAMGWVFSALGMFLLLGSLALLAAWVFKAGFVGWLISMGLMGLVIVAVIVTVNYVVLRPAR